MRFAVFLWAVQMDGIIYEWLLTGEDNINCVKLVLH